MTRGDEKLSLLKAIRDAAADRAEVPKLTLGYTVGMLAFGIIVVREYDGAWPLISVMAAFSVMSLLVAAAALVLRVTALKNIETLGSREMFEGRLPDPESSDYQRQLASYRNLYRLSGRVGLPALFVGAIALAFAVLFVIGYHVVKP